MPTEAKAETRTLRSGSLLAGIRDFTVIIPLITFHPGWPEGAASTQCRNIVRSANSDMRVLALRQGAREF